MTLVRHGHKLKKLGSARVNGRKPKIPKTRETIEIRIRDSDGKVLFKWDPAKGNLKQGLYECLDFTQRGLGINLDDVMEPPIVKEKIAQVSTDTKFALERLGSASKS